MWTQEAMGEEAGGATALEAGKMGEDLEPRSEQRGI